MDVRLCVHYGISIVNKTTIISNILAGNRLSRTILIKFTLPIDYAQNNQIVSKGDHHILVSRDSTLHHYGEKILYTFSRSDYIKVSRITKSPSCLNTWKAHTLDKCQKGHVVLRINETTASTCENKVKSLKNLESTCSLVIQMTWFVFTSS